MRFLLPGLAAAGMLVSQIAVAQPCTKPLDKEAFDVAGLKSQLMVTALSCDQRDKYNAFVMRYRSDLTSKEAVLKTYFIRSFGRRAQQEQDDYITNLANAQSQHGIKQGTLFCQQNVGMFDEVLSLPKGATLASFAAAKDLTQPIALVVCPATETVTRTAQASSSKSHKR